MENIWPRAGGSPRWESRENPGEFLWEKYQNIGDPPGGERQPPGAPSRAGKNPNSMGKMGFSWLENKASSAPTSHAGIKPGMVFPGKKRDWCPGADSAVINPVINPINPRVGHGGGDVIASELSILPRARSRSDFMDLGKFSSSSKAEGICAAGAESQRESPSSGDTERGPAPAALSRRHSPAANPGIRGWERAGSRGRVRGFTGEGAAAGNQLDPPRSSGSPRDSSSLHPAPKTSKTPLFWFFFWIFWNSKFWGEFWWLYPRFPLILRLWGSQEPPGDAPGCVH